jgi:carboxymethylenebutenolidase
MHIDLPGGVPAELTQPGQGEALAGLVIAPDIMGLRPLFVDMAQRIADDHQLTVVVVEPFPGQDLPSLDDRFAAMGRLQDEAVLRGLTDGADATGRSDVSLIGFCMGGMYTLKAAGLGRFARCVAFYGMIRVPTDWSGSGQGEPLEYLARATASATLAIVGGKDPYTPPDDVAEIEARSVLVARYPEAEHGFVHDPSRPAHRAEDAADAWRRCFEFLGV